MTVVLAEIHCNRTFEYQKNSTDQNRFTYLFSNRCCRRFSFVQSSWLPPNRTDLSVFSHSTVLCLCVRVCVVRHIYPSTFIDGPSIERITHAIFPLIVYPNDFNLNLNFQQLWNDKSKSKSRWNSTAYHNWQSIEFLMKTHTKVMAKWLADMLFMDLINFIGTQLKSRKNSIFLRFV